MTALLTLYAALLVGMVGLIGVGYWLGANRRTEEFETTNYDLREGVPDTDPQGKDK